MDTDGPSNQAKSVAKYDLAQIAKDQITFTNPKVGQLIDNLVDQNIHSITSTTKIEYNKRSGLFETALGPVTLEAISDARNILNELASGDSRNINNYLMLIPQDLGRNKLHIPSFLDSKNIQKQLGILDALEVTFDKIHKSPSKEAKKKTITQEQVFDLSIDLPTSQEEQRISDWFYKSKRSMHGYDRIKINDIFSININNNKLDEQIGNIQEVFHGTILPNCLSVIKTGLKIKPPSTARKAGSLFGSGTYGSTCSTKSLGYCFGRWGQGHSNLGTIFVCDFAMGKVYEPKSYGLRSLPKGYDSCWAKPKLTGLYNDELIVYKENQVKIKYLIICS